ncbi:MAG: endo-1,3-alpha-glucanase family glycosylhydrolase [bacterium]
MSTSIKYSVVVKSFFFPPICVAIVTLAAWFPYGGGDAPREPQVFAHYMPWFRAEKTADGQMIWEHWQWYGKGTKHDPDEILENGRRDIAAVSYPLIGPYDGRDPAVLEYHLLTAKAAGIDGFIADWYGPGTYSDTVFGELVKAASRCGMKVAICLEEKAFPPPYSQAKSRGDLKDVMLRHITHALATHGRSEAYLRRNGDPVFLVFPFWGEGPLGSNQLSTQEVAEVLARVPKEKVLLMRAHFDAPFAGIARGNYAWCSFDPKYRAWYYPTVQSAKAEGRIDYWLGMANPGFNDSGVNGWGAGPRIADRRGTQEYDDTWGDNLKFKPDGVQIVTWNDFEEGTTIEPTEEYKFTFVDLTEKYVGRLTGRRVDTDDNTWPWRIYKMRKLVGQLAGGRKQDWNARLNDYASDFVDGARFLMGWRLGRLERGLKDALAK